MKSTLVIISLVLCPFLIFSQVKVSVSDGNWGSANTWSPNGVPSSTDKVKIYHVVNLNQNYTASDTVFVYKQLNINNNKTLSLTPGTMILVNTATYTGQIGTVGNNASISGNFTFQKWVTRCDGFSTYGMPFDVSATSPNWYYCNQCQPSWSNLYYYNEKDTGLLEYGYYDTINNTLKRGRGFFYWYSNYAGGLNFPRQLSLNGSINFGSDFNFKVSYSPTGTGISDDGYNLLANPFPGTIDWLSGSWSKKKINNAIYTWNSCNGSYSSFVGGVGVNGGSRYISSMQGFWVQTNGADPSLKADAGILTGSSSTLLKPNSADNNPQVLYIRLGEDEIAIRLDSLSTDSFDVETDALKMLSENSRLYSTRLGQHYAINSIRGGNTSVSLRTRGEGALQFSGTESFQNLYRILLANKKDQEEIEISDKFEYPFRDSSLTGFQENFEIRFVLKQTKSLSLKEEQTLQANIRRHNDRVNIRLSQSNTAQVQVYDLFGRELYSEKFVEQTSIPYLNCPVIIRVQSGSQSYSKKML